KGAGTRSDDSARDLLVGNNVALTRGFNGAIDGLAIYRAVLSTSEVVTLASGTDTTPPSPADTIAPTIPTNLVATVISSTQINLSWAASTDAVGVDGYDIYRNGAIVGTASTPSYQDKNLTPSTTYTYAVVAHDAVGNTSAQSTSKSATTNAPTTPPADTTAPTVPTNLTATVISSTQINLSWTASTDNTAVTGYKIFRNGTQITTVTGTTYQSTGLTASTAYTYTVASYDAVGNTSAQTVGKTATTSATPIVSTKFVINDRIQVSSGPLNVRTTAATTGTLLGTQATGVLGTVIGGPTASGGYNWWNVNFDTGVDGWVVENYLGKYVAPAPVAPTVTLTVSPVSITAGTSATLSWSSTNATACTASGSWTGTKAVSGTSAVTPTATATYTLACTGTGGSVSKSVTVTVTPVSTKFSLNDRIQVSSGPLNVRATAATTGTLLGTQATGVLGTVIGGPTASGGYNWWNVNFDTGVDGWVAEDYLVKYVAPPADTTAPTVPTNLTATVISSTQINLSWTASTDNTAVTGYKIFRNGTQITTVTGTTYQSTGLTASTAYTYTVASYDAVGNTSAQTVGKTATTSATPVTPPAGDIWKPALNTSWQWQLTGLPVDQSVNALMFDIDVFDNDASVIASLKAKGKKVICYFSAGSYENWRPDAASFPATVKGKSNGWAGENWLDIRNIAILGPIMTARLDLAKSKGCDGVEPDNIDGYTNSTGFTLTATDQITYNKFLANEAHKRGLSIGLKNDIDQVTQLLPYFDWALNEQCFQYNECDTLVPFVNAGKAVFNVEYSLTTTAFCSKANAMNFNSLKKDLNLTATRTACR
ncbi:MAG: endo alpha-1,4 polygalactosaminidase, partial [Patescibacteria group bacterium]